MIVLALVIVAGVALLASVVLNVALVKRGLKQVDKREETVEMLERALDALDACYGRVAHNAELPVLFDDPVVRELISDMKTTKNIILRVASTLATYSYEDEEDEEKPT